MVSQVTKGKGEGQGYMGPKRFGLFRKRCRSFCVTGLSVAMIQALPNQAEADVRFVDRAGSLTIAHEYTGGWDHFVGGGVAVFDCDGDARPELFVAGGASPARLFLNRSEGELRFEVAETEFPTGVTGAYPLDIDGDGVTDLAVLRNGPNLWLKGAGDCIFAPFDAALNLPEGDDWSTAFTATWEPGQGLPTMVVANYVDADHPDAPFGTCATNWLIRPEGARYGEPIPLEPGFCALSALISDWRRDGVPMLRLSNDRHYYVRDGREQMWALDPLRELGEADGWPVQRLWGMGIGSRDLTGDGRPEVMLTSMGDQAMMLNRGDGFDPAPYEIGTYAHRPHAGGDGRPSTGWHAEFGDVNNDGRDDLFIAKGNVDQMPDMATRDPNNLLIQGADGRFTEASVEAGVASEARSRGAALADLNGDGLLDLVVVNRRAALEIWQNATEGAGGWLAVRLRQPGGNRDAIGAFVEVETDAGRQTREVTVGGGHVGGQLGAHHFGLGEADVARVRVIWPDGEVGDWAELSAGRIHEIVRD